MGFWDVLLFCIATVLGPRWIAAAARNGQSSISLWILAAVLFFVPTAFVVVELSTRFPEEGGLYVWTKLAFGDFHGFVAGWTYWIYTVFYFPGLLLASAAMTSYVGGAGNAWLAENRSFLLVGSFVMLFVAVFLNIIGLHIGKWLQNAGGVGTYVPLLMIVGVALVLWLRQGSVTHFTVAAMLPHWNWDTVNFWPQLAFAFAGLELVSAMSEEVRNPQRTFPRAIFASGGLIALMYIAGTVAVLVMLPSETVDPKSGVFQAITQGSTALRMAGAWKACSPSAGFPMNRCETQPLSPPFHSNGKSDSRLICSSSMWATTTITDRLSSSMAAAPGVSRKPSSSIFTSASVSTAAPSITISASVIRSASIGYLEVRSEIHHELFSLVSGARQNSG